MSTTTRSWLARPRSWRMLLQSTVGKKVIMGVTGLMMVGWVALHMTGNTLLYAGDEHLPFVDMSAMNFYGWVLQEGSHGAIWLMRAIMLTALGLHVWAAVSLTSTNAAARPTAYQHGHKRQRTSVFALSMRISGVLLLVYIIGHIAHLTFGLGVPDFEWGHPYETVIKAFQNPVVALLYVVANAGLMFHLFHATWSSLETLGFDHPQYNAARRTLSGLIALTIGAVNISFPLAVLLGVVR
jgi:succinate dehydrogenase / fumarate reductase cytochrome b subunit